MNITASQLSRNPRYAFKSASQGKTVSIKNDWHPEYIFELVARKKKPLCDGDTVPPAGATHYKRACPAGRGGRYERIIDGVVYLDFGEGKGWEYYRKTDECAMNQRIEI